MGNTLTSLRAAIAADLLLARATGRISVAQPPRWYAQHTNPDRNAERKECKRLGHRQYRKARKAARRLAREVAP
jgi:hypothetical protein